jgi:hypothetical protein
LYPFGKMREIAPVIFPPTFAPKAEVKIEAVDIHDDPAHLSTTVRIGLLVLTGRRALQTIAPTNHAGERISGPTPPSRRRFFL